MARNPDPEGHREREGKNPAGPSPFVRFNGWMGSKGRLIGGLAGLGVGEAIGAAVGYGLFNDSEGPTFILAPLIGVGIATIGFVAG